VTYLTAFKGAEENEKFRKMRELLDVALVLIVLLAFASGGEGQASRIAPAKINSTRTKP
jgi:hypothetical protein